MRSRGVEQDQVEPAVDDRADRPALAPHLVVVEMLVIELEAVARRGTAAAAATGS